MFEGKNNRLLEENLFVDSLYLHGIYSNRVIGAIHLEVAKFMSTVEESTVM